MARRLRLFIPGIPCHIVQRGNNRQACFFDNDDFSAYMHILSGALQRYDVQLHAFVLMTNHVHLLATPNSKEGIPRVMQAVGRHYVRSINYCYQRSGTLWEGRYKASLIDSDNYLLHCQRYIELNPVRAGMVELPCDYHWSSYHTNARGIASNLLTAHPCYLQLGKTASQRQYAYRELFSSALDTDQIHQIRQRLQHNYPLGNDKFKAQIEAALHTKIGNLTPGRPWPAKPKEQS